MVRVIVLDAGVLIAYLDATDAHHATAIELLEQEAPPFLIHRLTLAEVLVGPARRGREDQVVRDLYSIGVTPAESWSDEPIELARMRAEWGLKMPDTCVLVTAQHHVCDLMTFDKQLARVASREAVLHPALRALAAG